MYIPHNYIWLWWFWNLSLTITYLSHLWHGLTFLWHAKGWPDLHDFGWGFSSWGRWSPRWPAPRRCWTRSEERNCPGVPGPTCWARHTNMTPTWELMINWGSHSAIICYIWFPFHTYIYIYIYIFFWRTGTCKDYSPMGLITWSFKP